MPGCVLDAAVWLCSELCPDVTSRPKGGGPLRTDRERGGVRADGDDESGRRAGAGRGGSGQQVPAARRTVDGYLLAPFPWYGLDEAFTGPRWLMQVGTAADGTVEHGSIGHGDEPSIERGRVAAGQGAVRGGRDGRREPRTAERGRHRATGGHVGLLRGLARRVGAAVASPGPARWTTPCGTTGWTSRPRRPGCWRTISDGADWSTLSLPVDGVPTPFHYRESEFGWVLAGSDAGGRAHRGVRAGMSAYGLGFAVIKDIAAYDG